MKYSNSQTFITLRFWTLCCSIILYGAFGYPTPDNPGLVEIFIGLGLILSLGLPQNAFSLLKPVFQEPLWMKPARLLLIYGLSAPLIMAILAGNEMNSILRDVFPFFFMLLPFFACNLLTKITRSQQYQLLSVILFAGLCFSLRGYFVLKEGVPLDNLDALYLVNAPTVLFSALFLSGSAIYYISLRRPVFPALAAFMSLLPMAAMGLVLQRASFGALTLSGAFLSLLVFRHSLLRSLYLCLGAILLFALLKDYAYPLLHALLEKNRAVGSNMRLYELQAVWEKVSDSALTALIGQGWGGTVKSPAVGGLTVNFTHSLISAALLKTGLLGVILTMSFLSALFLRLPLLYRLSPVLAVSLFWPFAIDIFLYASYKSLDFGFILMLIACYGVTKEQYKESGKKDQQVATTGTKIITDQQGLSADSRGHRACSA